MRSYNVVVKVEGYYQVEVKAQTRIEAMKLGSEAAQAADFGELSSIDWNVLRADALRVEEEEEEGGADNGAF